MQGPHEQPWKHESDINVPHTRVQTNPLYLVTMKDLNNLEYQKFSKLTLQPPRTQCTETIKSTRMLILQAEHLILPYLGITLPLVVVSHVKV